MADYTTVDMTVRSLLADILRTDVPPAGAVGWGFLDDNGALISVSLGDLSTPAAAAAPGTGLASAIYEVGTSGAQTIPQVGATWFGDVGVRSANGKSVALDFGTGYTFVPDQLNILAVVGANLQTGDAITYTYASGVVNGQQPAPSYTAGDGIDITGQVISALVPELLDPLTYPVMAGTPGGYVGYATLEDAAAAAPNRPITVNVPRLNISQDVTLTGSLYAASLVQILIADGVTVTLTTGIRLHNIQFLRANGSTAKVALASSLGTGVVPDATQAVQLVDSRIGPDLVFAAVGHAITVRGRSAIDNATGNPGTIYLYDTATAGVSAGGPTLVDRRPGAAAAPSYTAGDYITISPTGVISASIAEPLTIIHQQATALDASAFGRRHVFTSGAGTYFANTLPDVTGNLNKTLTIIIDADATGLWRFVGGDFDDRLWAGESLQLQCTDTGYRRIGGNKIPMTCDIGLTPQGSQTMLGLSSGGAVNTLALPYTFLDQSPGMAQSNGTILIRRAGRYIPQLSGRVDAQQGSNIQLFAKVNGSADAANVAFNNLVSIGAVNSMSLPSLARNYKVGDEISFGYYFSSGSGAVWNATDYQYFLLHFSVTEITF